jgi:proteic killer suppression protein
MIRSFRHKGLRRFFETGSTAGIQPSHARRLRAILTLMNAANVIDDLGASRLRLHALKGDRQGRWSVWVNGNWRVTFELHDSHVYVLDYEDYH